MESHHHCIEKPLVSVVIPTHNRAMMVREAIDSVYAQEGIGELFDVEVIIIDDASTDTTPSALGDYQGIRYFRFETNRGASAARNAGIRESSGKYIAFLDDDDRFLPHRLRVQVPLMENQEEVGVIYGQSRVIRDEKLTADVWPESGPSGHVFLAFLTLTDDFLHPTTVLVRRELFTKAGLFDESLPTMEHHDMFLRLAFYAPWLFLHGPVAEGRFSTKGKWFTNVVKRNNEKVLPGIVEKALAMLPDLPEYQEVRENARISVCVTIANQRWDNGGLSDVREHLMATLHKYPWMLGKERITQCLRVVAREIGRTSHAPLADIAAFVDELQEMRGRHCVGGWLWKQRILGEFLTEASIACRKKSPAMAVCAAALAITRNPYQAVILMKRAIEWYHSHRTLQAG